MAVECEIIVCRFCGNEFATEGKRGRPREYCPGKCGEAQKYLNAFLKIADETDLTESSRKLLRSELLSFVNQKLHNNKKLNLGTKNN